MCAIRFGCCVGAFFLTVSHAAGDVGELQPTRPGFRIASSARVAPGTYELPDGNDSGAIIIAGDDITVDFQGASLIGAKAGAAPDTYVGRGIVIHGRNVTVKNVEVHGYTVGVFAEDSPGLRLQGCDVSRNYRQRLKSTIRYEDFSDWLFGHENDENEWLRYGAGIYLFRCPDATVVECRARNGQNGLCISRCDRARIVDNDMSFMSGWGLAMWRSSHCEVFNNKFDWCMRGYSHGVYSRGQDSAGIFVYEQCNNNLFAYNSATHGGDGFFLYAGNETLKKTGRGGCNGNVVYRNDFSHAAANGIEATFSANNIFVENTLHECHHGVWAGYSYDTVIRGNDIRNCTYGVSIEHGRRNVIGQNLISDTKLGVQLWWDRDEDLLASVFGKTHEGCPSSFNQVLANRFERVETAVRLDGDTGSFVGNNEAVSTGTLLHLKGNTKDVECTAAELLGARIEAGTSPPVKGRDEPVRLWGPTDVVARYPRLIAGRGEQHAFLPDGARRGREHIFIDEWGPYDFTDFRVFPSRILSGPQGGFQLLGPGTTFHVIQVNGGVNVKPTTGKLPQKLIVEAPKQGVYPFAIEIEADGRVQRVKGVLLNTEWRIQYYGWSEEDDPRNDPEAWDRIISKAPLAELTSSELDYVWYSRAPSEKVSRDRFATVATTTVNVPAGRYWVRTVSDDGVRVFVDGKEVVADWTWHPATPNDVEVRLEAGPHEFRVEHFEIDGYAQLQFWLEPDAR